MHYHDEGYVDVNMVRYDICILSLEYCINEVNEIKYIQLGLRVLH
jgi:hypothetical protein